LKLENGPTGLAQARFLSEVWPHLGFDLLPGALVLVPSVLAERGSEISRYSNHIALSLSGCFVALFLRGGESFGQHRDASQVNCAHCRGLAHLQNRICDSVGARFVALIFPYVPTFSTESRHEEELLLELKTLLAAVIGALVWLAPAWASPQTVTLNVSGMTCPACPITVKKALAKVPGVSKVDVRFEKKQVLVTFDDAKTNTNALVKATTNAGYPSQRSPRLAPSHYTYSAVFSICCFYPVARIACIRCGFHESIRVWFLHRRRSPELVSFKPHVHL